MRRRRSRRALVLGPERLDLNTLATRAAEGDSECQRAFVERTMDDVWRFCAHTLGVAQADDALQLTYMRALKSLPRFRGESSAKTWLIGVARNTCLDELRSRGRRERILDKVARQPLDTAVSDDMSVDYADSLASLEPTRREAFLLTQVLGFSYGEAAEVAGCPVGTIRSRVARARLDLLGALETSELDQPIGAV